jgi:hypothetical protein
MGKASEWLSSIKARFTATPGTEVLGFDRAQKIRSIAAIIEAKGEEGRRRLQEAESHWKYETRESYVCLARRLTSPKLRREGFEVVTATAIPGCGDAQARGRAWTIEDAEIELRFDLAHLYVKCKVVRDFDEARERASKVELHTERSQVLESL